MNKLLMAGIVMALTGCVTVHERTAVDEGNNMIQYRYDPFMFDGKQIKIDANAWCKARGFGKATASAPEHNIFTGVAKVWFECE